MSHTGPAELDARLRLLLGRWRRLADDARGETCLGDLVIDDRTYLARLDGRPLNLTHKEFELLNHLARHPGKVFTREHLLQEVWGVAFVGGTRTVDVHVRRLRSKFGTDYQSLIATVRNVGYKAVPTSANAPSNPPAPRDSD
jgi:DNA-binding response OmpR family regulator